MTELDRAHGGVSADALSFIIAPPLLSEVRFLGREIWAIFTAHPTLISEALGHPLVQGLNAYITLNELKADTPERHGATRDALFRARRNQLAADADVSRRRLILFDSDSVKPTGAAATDAQRAAAHAHSATLEATLTAEGWPAPVACDSGNGAHRLYSVDLPNDRETDFLISNLLHLAARKFDTDAVKLDKSVSNAGRITRLYGSRNHKAGRDSAVLSIPDPLVCVSGEQIEALVKKWRGSLGYKKRLRSSDWTPERMEALLDFHGIGYLAPVEKPQGLLWVLSPCPFNPDHSGSSPAVMITKHGWPKFKCLHNSCHGKGWREFLAHLNITNGKVFPWKSWSCENKSVHS
jgi:hypothetical protein